MEPATCHELALKIHRYGYQSAFSPLPGAFLGRRAQIPVGHKRGLAPALPESATEEGLVGRVLFIANEKGLWLEAGRSATYDTWPAKITRYKK
jgi:hypothetical protein